VAIEWNYELMTTRSPEIDAEHTEWIRRFNQFEDAVLNRRGVEAMHDALQFFFSYTATHFPHEEALMERHKCPSADLNRAEHGRFVEKLRATEAWIGSDGASMVEVMGLKADLEHWLTNHISKVDAQLRTVLDPPTT